MKLKNLLLVPLVVAVLVLIFPFVAFAGDHIMVTTTTSMLPVLKPNDISARTIPAPAINPLTKDEFVMTCVFVCVI